MLSAPVTGWWLEGKCLVLPPVTHCVVKSEPACRMGKCTFSMKKSSPESKAIESSTYLSISASFLLLAIKTKASGCSAREVEAVPKDTSTLLTFSIDIPCR